ncbi:hypothetical protein LUZ63_016294 [Rhynchospora breviuscula]|uniref:Malectin-like domain-containing protein n=1 Tax=Rhynchospora breviuscula TaxID=2022672 RepID=A0A9Q0C0X5_9POAL|nr:hypothetical protein LUZ63_016294 [Rhynchospora breviuscula]
MGAAISFSRVRHWESCKRAGTLLKRNERMQLGSALLFLFLHTFLSTIPLVFASQDEPFTLRISCGSREDVHTLNAFWYRDFGYTNGRFANATLPSLVSPQLQTLRFFPISDGPENCYHIDNIPAGRYQIRVFLALIDDPYLASAPLFDLSVEGTLFASIKPGWTGLDEQSFVEAIVDVTDSSATICFHRTGHGDPSILSIEVLQIDYNAYYLGKSLGTNVVLRPVRRLSCWAEDPMFDGDMNGVHWGGNRFWKTITFYPTGDYQVISTKNVIAGTSISPNFYPQALYQSAIAGTDRESQLSFEIAVDHSKTYSLWLHFAEIDPEVTKEFQRVFDVLINGFVMFKEVDVIRLTGEPYAALVLNTTLSVIEKSVKITLKPLTGHAIISAIEIVEVITAEMATSLDEVSALQTIKTMLGLPLKFGWNGDPCVPQQHQWNGVNCQFDSTEGKWVIDKLMLDNQGLRGFLPNDISKLRHLQSINLSENSIRGTIPVKLGDISALQVLDLSYNEFSGTIPESLGALKNLQILNLSGNSLTGKVPATLGGQHLHFNLTGNNRLCGNLGLPECGPHQSVGAKIGIAFGSLFGPLLVVIFINCWWKRRQNILRAQQLAAAMEAPYAKAMTHFRDVQLGKKR